MTTKKNPETFSLIPRPILRVLYSSLVRCRILDEFAGGGWKRTTVHEAPAIAIVLDLKAGDTIAASERDFLPPYVSGTPFEDIVSPLRIRASHPRAPFAAALNMALAAARAGTQKKNHSVAAIFGNGAQTRSAAWRRALRIAGAERLPILFVGQPGPETAPRKAAALSDHGFPVITVDRDDVVALYRVASEALAHARRGNGSTLIECIAWPFAQPHNGDAAGGDAILNMERYLAQMGVPFERWKKKAITELGRGLRTVGGSARTTSIRRKPRPA